MLNLSLPYILPTLTHLVNASIKTSTFPDIWKVATVRPLPKNTNPVDVKDLRPISILPCLTKVMEKVVWAQLSAYLGKYDILSEFQSGFRKRRGTATALLDVTDNILLAVKIFFFLLSVFGGDTFPRRVASIHIFFFRGI